MFWYTKDGSVEPTLDGSITKANEKNKNGTTNEVENSPKKKKSYTISAVTHLDIAVDDAREELKYQLYFQVLITICTLLALFEAILIGFNPTGVDFILQVLVLALSTVFYGVMIYVVASVIPARIEGDESEGVDAIDSTIVERIIAAMDGEVYFELLCLIIGWACIFDNTGVASLRAFRIFRYLWYLELYVEEKGPDYKPEEHVISIIHSSQLCLKYLEKITVEVFSEKSKGGLVILGIFFYVSYVIAVCVWNIRRDLGTPEGDSCLDLTSCYIVMLRLSFYDGTGFDFLQTVIVDKLPGLGLILILYMCFSAMILLNGLIGIFGLAFSLGGDDDDDDDDGDAGAGASASAVVELQSKLRIAEANLEAANETIRKMKEESTINAALVDRIVTQLTRLEK